MEATLVRTRLKTTFNELKTEVKDDKIFVDFSSANSETGFSIQLDLEQTNKLIWQLIDDMCTISEKTKQTTLK